MGGYFPGPAGFAAFADVKFGGYLLAGIALRKLDPAISASAVKIGATRTGLGILLGPPMTLLGAFFVDFLFKKSGSEITSFVAYLLLFLIRIFVWALVIYHFAKRTNLARSNLWAFAALRAVWSCMLDWPGFKLAMIGPGQIPVC